MKVLLTTFPSYDILLLHPIFVVLYVYPITRSIQYKSTAWLYVCIYSLSFTIALASMAVHFHLLEIYSPVADNPKCNGKYDIGQYMYVYIVLFIVIHMTKIGVHPIRKFTALSKQANYDMAAWWGAKDKRDISHDVNGSIYGNIYNLWNTKKSQVEIFLPFLVTCFSFIIYYPAYIYLRPCV
ncbi:MAG: hypothetical protein OEV92_07335 [Nitrospinota bacterium]|nr:hypothetical protein [Nitrospinota bacterium]